MYDMPIPEDDGLYIPSVGQWSCDKHWFLGRYIDAFTTSMRKKKWDGLYYIDLFAGAGIERLEGSEKLCWGSPMIAAQAPRPFDGLYFCEKNAEMCNALKARMEKIVKNTHIVNGYANDEICDIVRKIPKNALSLAFLDPFGLHLAFDTLKTLSTIRCDLIIFFPDYLDAMRNWEHNYFDSPKSNLDRCLGKGADWRAIINNTPRNRIAETLRELYVKQIKKLGYTEFAYQRIEAKNHPLYILILCARNKLAVQLWDRISQKRRDGQRMIPFD